MTFIYRLDKLRKETVSKITVHEKHWNSKIWRRKGYFKSLTIAYFHMKDEGYLGRREIEDLLQLRAPESYTAIGKMQLPNTPRQRLSKLIIADFEGSSFQQLFSLIRIWTLRSIGIFKQYWALASRFDAVSCYLCFPARSLNFKDTFSKIHTQCY